MVRTEEECVYFTDLIWVLKRLVKVNFEVLFLEHFPFFIQEIH